jgi:hypothetical protein
MKKDEPGIEPQALFDGGAFVTLNQHAISHTENVIYWQVCKV